MQLELACSPISVAQVTVSTTQLPIVRQNCGEPPLRNGFSSLFTKAPALHAKHDIPGAQFGARANAGRPSQRRYSSSTYRNFFLAFRPTAMMATLGVGSGQVLRRHALANIRGRCSSCADQHATRLIANSRRPLQAPIGPARSFTSQSGGKRPRFSQRLGEALRNSKITWYHIPVGVGIGFLGLVQFYKVTAREKEKRREEEGVVSTEKPKRRPRIRPDGPW
jgi:phosphatidylserine decarboxylase